MLARDERFRSEARVAVHGFDEASFGSGVNVMRFLTAGKPLLGFYDPERKSNTLNLSNILQLRLEFPELVTLVRYRDPEEIPERGIRWLDQISDIGEEWH